MLEISRNNLKSSFNYKQETRDSRRNHIDFSHNVSFVRLDQTTNRLTQIGSLAITTSSMLLCETKFVSLGLVHKRAW